MKTFVGSHHILMMTLDTLRFDVAEEAWSAGLLNNFSVCLSGWERRHSPANFTFAAHQAFFAGYLPTVIGVPDGIRRFASRFEGSETIGNETYVFDEPNLPMALAHRGYETHCIGGVGFFNQKNSLGRVLPSMFQQSYWEESMGVSCPDSAENQFALASEIVKKTVDRRIFLFINISALHQPNCFYVPDCSTDSPETQLAALAYVDRSFALLLEAMRSTTPWFGIICSDHGTAYGEEGRTGHRWNHPVIGDVPYAEFELKGQP